MSSNTIRVFRGSGDGVNMPDQASGWWWSSLSCLKLIHRINEAADDETLRFGEPQEVGSKTLDDGTVRYGERYQHWHVTIETPPPGSSAEVVTTIAARSNQAILLLNRVDPQ